MQKYAMVAAGIAVSLVLGATVFKERVAWAAQSVDANITNVDANGNVKVHEQGTANVIVQGTPTVNVAQRVLRRDHAFLSLNDLSMTIPAGVVVTDIVFFRSSSGPRQCQIALFEDNVTLLTQFAVSASQPNTMVDLESGIRSTRGAQLSLFLLNGCDLNVLWTGYEE
jgi:hypothetical protein